MFDCLWRCLSPKSSNVGDWRFAIAKPPYELRTTNYELRTTNYELRTTNYELRTTNWANLPFDNPPKSEP
jgi:hypothetical protein